tara:strand:+ start:1698 stop:2045 length:348 start_codon:yes stop_codon:yes gene_type:complete
MKKLLLLLALSTTLLSTAQKGFSGSWISETSSYYTNILADSTLVTRVINISFHENRVIEETIIKQEKDSFKTLLTNKLNGYKVQINYILKDDNNLTCVYTGDLNRTIKLKRVIKN